MSAQQFKSQVLQLFFHDLHQLERDNYDAGRFSFDGVDRSQVFYPEKHAQSLEWFFENYEALFRTYTRLADQRSRDLYVNLIRYKFAGHLHVRIQNDVWGRQTEAQRFKAHFSGSPSAAAVTGMFGGLVHYDHEWNGVRYVVDTIRDSLVMTVVYRQYFFERDGVTVAPAPGDHVIDGGSCLGDTIAIFREAAGPAGRIYAFEPVGVHLEVCGLNVAQAGYANVDIFPFGLSDRNVDAPPAHLSGYHPGYHPNAGEAPTPLRRIDDLVMSGAIERIDFLKLDVEGSEVAALRGAASALHRFRPKLAISIYHRPNDFFEVCDFVHDLGLGYTFYLDSYTIHDEETVLYAVAS